MTDTDNPNDEAWDKAIANIEYVYQLNKALTGTTNSALRAAARDILEAPRTLGKYALARFDRDTTEAYIETLGDTITVEAAQRALKGTTMTINTSDANCDELIEKHKANQAKEAGIAAQLTQYRERNETYRREVAELKEAILRNADKGDDDPEIIALMREALGKQSIIDSNEATIEVLEESFRTLRRNNETIGSQLEAYNIALQIAAAQEENQQTLKLYKESTRNSINVSPVDVHSILQVPGTVTQEDEDYATLDDCVIASQVKALRESHTTK